MVKRSREDQPHDLFTQMRKTQKNKNAWSPIWLQLIGLVPCIGIVAIAIAANIGTSARIHSEVERNFGDSVASKEKMEAYTECIKLESLSVGSRHAMTYRFACDSLKKEALKGS